LLRDTEKMREDKNREDGHGDTEAQRKTRVRERGGEEE
jgi:hypothetical protein